jgi:hypothetical protein
MIESDVIPQWGRVMSKNGKKILQACKVNWIELLDTKDAVNKIKNVMKRV